MEGVESKIGRKVQRDLFSGCERRRSGREHALTLRGQQLEPLPYLWGL